MDPKAPLVDPNLFLVDPQQCPSTVVGIPGGNCFFYDCDTVKSCSGNVFDLRNDSGRPFICACWKQSLSNIRLCDLHESYEDRRYQGDIKATSKRHQSDIKEALKRRHSDIHIVKATHYQGDIKATSKWHQMDIKAPSRRHWGEILATSKRHQGHI